MRKSGGNQEFFGDMPENIQMIKAVGEFNDIILWAMDKDFNITFSNKSYKDYLGKIKPTDNLCLYEDDKVDNLCYNDFLQTVKDTISAGNSYHGMFILPDGRCIKAWVSTQKGISGANSIIGWGQDITAELHSKQALIKSEAKFRHVFETLQDVFFRCQLDGKILLISPSAQSLTGYAPEELHGKDITNFYLYSVTINKLLRSLIKTNELKNLEIALVHKSGKIIPTICNLRLYREDNEWFIEGTAKDIAEIKQTNEELEYAIALAKESLEVKERFLANISHEIRTPLNGIIGMINVLGHSDLTKEQTDYVLAVKQSADILHKLLNNLLDWSKLEAGRVSINFTPISLPKLIENVVLIYSQKASENDIEIRCEFDKNLPQFVLTDEIKLTQIFSNLLSNAIKFSPSGSEIFIKVSVVNFQEHKLQIKCEVIDAGAGISEEEKSKLFESFSQLDNSLNRPHEGAGLGLSISKQLVRLLGGDINVDSKPGEGSNFWFTFNTEVAAKNDNQVSTIVRVEKFDYKPRVLVVDDNKINLEVAVQILLNAGAITTKATSGEKAIEILKESPFDLILLDIQMPGMSGIDVMLWIKKELTRKPAVIALTAFGADEEREKFLSLGFDDFIGKPISPEDLLAKVKQWTKMEAKIIDTQVLRRLSDYGGDEMVKEALLDFYEDAASKIKECFVLLSENNHREILNILHAIKGNAGTLGINKLAKCAEQIEEQLKKGYISKLDKDLSDLEYYFEEFKAYYFKQF